MKSEKKGISLNVKLFAYFFVFSATLICLMWIFQIGLLNTTYKSIRVREVRRTANVIVSDIEKSSFDSILYGDHDLQLPIQMGAIIIDMDSGDTVFGNEQNISNLLGRSDSIVRKLLELIELKGDNRERLVYITNEPYQKGFMRGYDTRFSLEDSDTVNSLAYMASTSEASGQEILVILLSELAPLTATVSTLRYQLLIITIIVLIVSIIISLIASKRIARPIENLNHNTGLMATGNYDVTFNGTGYREIEQLSNTLNETAVRLKQADQLTKDLIANVSHDLRTPLTMISGYGELMRDVPGENTPENVQVIIDEAKRLTYLVNNLLDISKLQAGNISLAPTSINATDMIVRIASSYQKMLENDSYVFSVDTDDDELYVYGDTMRLEQVFHNLINNAITHIGDDKTVIISARKINDKVRFDVIDHGDGISPKDIDHIWERYYKVDKEHVMKESGSGLGLSIVKSILELHKARFGVNSEPGKGADFWFELDCVKEDK